VTTTTGSKGDVTIRVTATGEGVRTFTVRADNLDLGQPTRTVTLRAGRPGAVEWKGRAAAADAMWVAVVVPDGDVSRRREVRQPAESARY
jgi:hypothetical protein